MPSPDKPADAPHPHYYGFGLSKRPHLHGRELGGNARLLQHFMDEANAVADEPFVGLTADGHVQPGLYPLKESGLSTRPIVKAAEALLDALTDEQRAAATFPVDAPEWQRWSNISPFLFRHGVLLEALDDSRRALAVDLLASCFSAAGLALARDVMRLNYTIGEITGNMLEYGEWVYWLSIFGVPSEDRPWGWQIDGHHLNVNCLLSGGQLVMTPMFMGSEPVVATTGIHKGVSVLQAEQDRALALMRSLDAGQRGTALLSRDMPPEMFAGAFRDNLILEPAGILFDQLGARQQSGLLDLIGLYSGRLRPGHDQLKMDEIRAHLGQTRFAWMGADDEEAVFYYRIHSPVLLIEFDHQRGVAFDNTTPSRNHIHTLVRTPNGNDYGKDWLRQHHERIPHTHSA